MPVDARHGRLAVGAECGDDARLTFGDDVKAACGPRDDRNAGKYGNAAQTETHAVGHLRETRTVAAA